MKKKLLVVALGLSSSIILGGCGGGSDDSSGSAAGVGSAAGAGSAADSPESTPVFYNAKVIDGYLKNADVWLDINGDKQLDSSEPSTLSGDGGVAALDVTDIVNPQQYAIYAKIIVGQTEDEDGDAIVSDYMMSAPPGDTEVTPLSTLVHITIEQNTDGSETPEALEIVKTEAIAEVAKNFGIQESDVLSDYIASGSGSSTYVAKNIVNSKILPEDESEFSAAISDAADTSTFNKQVAVVGDLIKDVVIVVAEDDLAAEGALFTSGDLDTDTDTDGVPDGLDAFPADVNEWLDTDKDTIGNNADPDDDDDGVEDSIDVAPLDPDVSEYAECVIKYMPEGVTIDAFNTSVAACEGLPEMDLAGNALIRLTGSIQPRAYVFNMDNTADFYRNGIKYNRVWNIDENGNLALYYGDGQTLNYLLRLIDDSTEDLKFAVYDSDKQSVWTTTYQDIDVSVDVLACEDLSSGWNDATDEPQNYRSYEQFKQTVTSCQEGKLVADLSAGFIDQGIILTTSDALSPADDVESYQFNKDGTGVFTSNEGVGDVSLPMNWTVHEEGILKVTIAYTDSDSNPQTAHDFLAIVETNGIDFSMKIFSRSTEWKGIGDTDLGDLWSDVFNADNIE
ncbi:hypothetical protein [Moritella marina]|uniref:hypothetical protein n=1 Tax=Moritella marina TaxID=90736 RepID=UPI00370431AA